tara:strand:- start:2721 stop:3104 length:384 start_codon:yes stop_codon:yes gene_type:complete
MSMIQVNLMHIFLISPTLLFIGTLNEEYLSDNNKKYIDFAFNALILYSLLIPFIVRRNFIKKIFSTEKLTIRNWINLLHYIFFMGLFFYIGYQGRNISNLLQYECIILGILMISIHINYLINKIYKN